MGYVGQAPTAAVLTADDITDGIIANVDIASDAAIALSKTALSAGTGVTLSTNTLNVDAAQTGITSLLATDIKIGEDAQTIIDFETANEIHFDADNAERVKIDATGLNVVSGSLETATIDYTDGDLAMTIADGGGVTFAQAVDLGSNTLTSTGSMQIRTIDYSDGDLAMTIADGGGVTFAQDVTMTADMSLNLPQGANVKFTDAITQDSIDDHDAQGIIMTFQAGMTVTPFSPVYLHTDDEVHECDADGIATMPAIGVSVNTSNVADGNPIEVMVLGLIRDESFTDFATNGAPVYVSTTVGEMTNTAPSGEDDVVQVIGHSVGEKLLFVQPCLTTIEHTG